MISFVDHQSDLNTLNFIAKSVEPEVLEKALNRAGLVQREIQYRTASGKMAIRKQWVKADEEQTSSSPPKAVTEETPVKKQTSSSPQTNNSPSKAVTEEQPAKDKKQKPAKDKDKEQKRPQVEATPHKRTERTKHLVPLSELSEVPEHVKALDIPPSWRYVMVSPDPHADLLAMGKDDQNRTQYIYSKEHTARGKAQKFGRIQKLMKDRSRLLSLIDSLEDREAGDCLNLIYHMGIRPGSTRNTKAAQEALGATTLRGENVVEENGKVFLRFVGKKGVYQDHEVPSKELSEMLVRRKRQAGDSGNLFNTTDAKLRQILKPLEIHTKDLRTMLATTTAQEMLKEIPPTTDPSEFGKIRLQVGEKVCKLLGNRREESLRSYIDPSVFEQWSSQGMKNWQQAEANKKTKTQKGGQ